MNRKNKKAMRYFAAYVKAYHIAQHEHTHADIRIMYTKLGNHFANKYIESSKKCSAL